MRTVPLRTGPLIVLLAIALGGCASVRGSQLRLTSADLKDGAICPSEAQLTAPHVGETKGEYRDRIIMVCVKAINANYGDFTDQLSKEAGIANLGTDLISQSLATAASVVDKASLTKKLAAGSALSLGIGSTINKDLFYKQTLPAIIASMEARRSKVLTAIAKAQNSDPDAKVYTLARAGNDLDLLQQAGSLAAAVRELTSVAVDNANKAEQQRQIAERSIDYGLAQPTSAEIDRRVRAAAATIRKLVKDNKVAQLRAIATKLNLNSAADADANTLGLIIRDEVNDTLTLPDATAQEAQIRKVENAIAESQGAVQ